MSQIEEAEVAGAAYASEQVNSDHFRDWVHEQVAEARRAPDQHFQSDTPEGAKKAARNMLKQLEWDTKRELDPREVLGGDATAADKKAFFEGFAEELHRPETQEWLADEIQHVNAGFHGLHEAPRGSKAQWLRFDRMGAGAFAEDLRDVLQQAVGDRQVAVRAQPSLGGRDYAPSVYVNFINLPKGIGGAGGGAEAENNRMSFWIRGFDVSESSHFEIGGFDASGRTERKLQIEMSNSALPREYKMRKKTASPGAIAQYLTDFLGKVVAEVPPKFTHTTMSEASRRGSGDSAAQRAEIDAALQRYGAHLTEDGFITKDEKVLGVRLVVEKGRLRAVASNGNLLASFPASRIDAGVADFVERFWFWKPVVAEHSMLEASNDAEHGIEPVPPEARAKALEIALAAYRNYREVDHLPAKRAYHKTWEKLQRAVYGMHSQVGYFIRYAHHISEIVAEAQAIVEAELPANRKARGPLREAGGMVRSSSDVYVPPALAAEGITPNMLEILQKGMGAHAGGVPRPGDNLIYDRAYTALVEGGYIVRKRANPGLSGFADYFVLDDKGASVLNRYRVEMRRIGEPARPSAADRLRAAGAKTYAMLPSAAAKVSRGFSPSQTFFFAMTSRREDARVADVAIGKDEMARVARQIGGIVKAGYVVDGVAYVLPPR